MSQINSAATLQGSVHKAMVQQPCKLLMMNTEITGHCQSTEDVCLHK